MKRHIAILSLLLCIASASATRRALIFGLGKQADSCWGKINGDNDVYYVEQMLRTIGYTDIVKLRNEEATKAAMVQAFIDLAGRCRKGDVVYVHYSGHGQLMTDLNGDEAEKWNGRHAQWDEAWIPYDAYMHYCPEDRGEKHLCDDEVAMLLSVIRQKVGSKGEIVVAIDACHSGDATCGEADEPVRGVDVKFNIPKTILDTPAEPVKEEWLTISACLPYQLCTEIKDIRIGKLTYALYSLGAETFKMSGRQLESTLRTYMEMHKGRLPQTPMVTGKK